MKCAPALVVVLLVAASLCGCARQTSVNGQQRVVSPSMADSVGPTGMSRDSRRYMAADPP